MEGDGVFVTCVASLYLWNYSNTGSGLGRCVIILSDISDLSLTKTGSHLSGCMNASSKVSPWTEPKLQISIHQIWLSVSKPLFSDNYKYQFIKSDWVYRNPWYVRSPIYSPLLQWLQQTNRYKTINTWCHYGAKHFPHYKPIVLLFLSFEIKTDHDSSRHDNQIKMLMNLRYMYLLNNILHVATHSFNYRKCWDWAQTGECYQFS